MIFLPRQTTIELNNWPGGLSRYTRFQISCGEKSPELGSWIRMLTKTILQFFMAADYPYLQVILHNSLLRIVVYMFPNVVVSNERRAIYQSPTLFQSQTVRLYRKPRKASPASVSSVFLQSKSSYKTWRGSLISLDIPPSPTAIEYASTDEFLLHENENEKSLSDEGNNILEADNTEECTEVHQKRRRRRWGTLTEENKKDKVVRRERKSSAKGHECTKCSHFRLQKYFKDSSCMICISCLDICYICSQLIVPPPSRQVRHPQCSSCNEKIKTRKQTNQRISMQTLRLKKKNPVYSYFTSKICFLDVSGEFLK